jgi:hypothetical protein
VAKKKRTLAIITRDYIGEEKEYANYGQRLKLLRILYQRHRMMIPSIHTLPWIVLTTKNHTPYRVKEIAKTTCPLYI